MAASAVQSDRKITKGDKVYRVVVNLTPEGVCGPEWRIEEREVVMVRSDGVIKLSRSFPDMVTKQFSPHALGSLFFRTSADSVRDFAIRQRRNIESAQRMVEEAGRAIAWAERAARAKETK